MSRMLALVLVLSLLLLTLTPFATWSAQPLMKHDCRQEHPKGSFYCDRGPLAGKRFASRKAMVEALKNSFDAEANRKNGKTSAGSSSKMKASVR